MNKRLLFLFIYVCFYQLVTIGCIYMVASQWSAIVDSSKLGMALICGIALLGSALYWILFYQNVQQHKMLIRKEG